MSTVRRPGAHRAYIREVSRQTTILRLQGTFFFTIVALDRHFNFLLLGFLFFGTITYVEETIKNIIEDPSWQRRPVRFLVVDLTLVGGVDMSSAEAFVRVHRMLSAKNVILVFCGFDLESAIGKALESVGVLGADFVELFSTFNDAMECKYLALQKKTRANEFRFNCRDGERLSPSLVQITKDGNICTWYVVLDRPPLQLCADVGFEVLPGRQDADIHPSLPGSHRHSHLRDVGQRTMHGGRSFCTILSYRKLTSHSTKI
jgi:SulP family sulfate permease